MGAWLLFTSLPTHESPHLSPTTLCPLPRLSLIPSFPPLPFSLDRGGLLFIFGEFIFGEDSGLGSDEGKEGAC